MVDHHPRVLDPDLAVPARGDATLPGFSSEDGVVTTGTWTHAGGLLQIKGEYDEVCVLLQGHVRLTDAAGYTAEFKAGETFVIPKAFRGTWETIEPVRKHYVIYDRAAVRN